MLEPYVRALLYTEDGKQYPSTAEGLQEGLKAARRAPQFSKR